MAALEERVAFLEGRVAEHSRGMDSIRDAVVSLEQRVDRRFEAVEARFAALEDKMDRRFGDVGRRFAEMDSKMSRQFVWLVGIQVTTLAAIVAALAAP